MESALLTSFMLSCSVVYYGTFLPADAMMEWNDVVVARQGNFATLVCIDKTATGAVSVNWMVKTLGTNQWKLVLSANERKEFSGGASKDSMQLTDHNFQDTGNFSLTFWPQKEDGGLYMCLVKQRQQVLKEKFILLTILTVTMIPAGPIPPHSTLRLLAHVQPDTGVDKITWAAPGDISMKTVKIPKGTITKLPQVQPSDHGAYVCVVYPRGNSSKALFPFNVDVTVNPDKVGSFTNITHGQIISTATQAQSSFPLTCPVVQGDYVLLYWRPADTTKQSGIKLVYQYDRWRGFTLLTEPKKLQLAGAPYNAQTGSFSFLLSPGIKDGGLYICEVYLNDNAFSQWTMLSVVKVKTRQLSSKLELDCRYSELSQVQSAIWKHQNESHHLSLSSNGPGTISTTLALPITAATAGNYSCVLQLKNGQIVRATHTITLPSKDRHNESVGVTAPALLPSLSALLLLVPLAALAVSALLWRQRHISERGIEQSLSVRSGEAENIYENPEDIRQAPPQGSVYMDLKPRGEDDVYKELER